MPNSKEPLTISLCVSTYNRPASLRLCLESILQQTIIPDEILIGDDGSTGDTRTLILEYINKVNVPLIHIWQPDEGFRLSAVRNNCFRKAKGNYLIQIDGDLVLEKRFVEDHIRFARPKTFLCGSRSLINDGRSKTLEQQGWINWDLVKPKMIHRSNAHRSLLFAYLIYSLRKGIHQTRYVLGSNMSFWREDLLFVNGYNEDFTGWGKEDNDIALRLVYAGIKIRFLRNVAISYHLDHAEPSTSNLTSNLLLLKETRDRKIFFAKNGIRKQQARDREGKGTN